jgi:hypothetical protein
VTQDDLSPWQDSELVAALTSSGTPAELSGEDDAVAAFQASRSARRRRGIVRFLGTGMTSVALAGVVGGGVAAAAYTKSLPEPVQQFFHGVLGPIGVPAPPPDNNKGGGHKSDHSDHTIAAGTASPASQVGSPPPAAPDASTSPHPSARPSPADHHVAPPALQPSPSVTVSPQLSASPSPSTTASPSPAGPAGDPSTWTMTASASQQHVQVHHGVQISGVLLDAAGQPVADHRVVVRVHIPGTPGWQQAAIRNTAADGSVQAFLGDLTANRVIVLGAGDGVHSSPLRIVVHPALSVSVAPSSDGTSFVVTVSADGGDPGDLVTVLKHAPQGWQQVGQAQLDGSSSASFAVPAPRHHKRFVVRLRATRTHGFAAARFVLPPTS